MSWRDLVQTEVPDRFPAVWLGGNGIDVRDRSYGLRRLDFPPEYGWYSWLADGRFATSPEPIEPQTDRLAWPVIGYLVGDRIVSDAVSATLSLQNLFAHSARVYLIDTDLERFSRVSAGRLFDDGPLVFRQQEMPVGPEDQILEAYLDRRPNLVGFKEVHPALDVAFRLEVFRRAEAEHRRLELAELRRKEAEARELEERRQALVAKLGDGAGRREMAGLDFVEAARAALAVGGAELLDHRQSRNKEHVVKYRLDGQRYECSCNDQLQIIDAGVCLVDHQTGRKGDKLFTLESLPGVVRQADREGVLVVFRHV